MRKKTSPYFILTLIALATTFSCTQNTPHPDNSNFSILTVGQGTTTGSNSLTGIPVNAEIKILFSEPVNTQTAGNMIFLNNLFGDVPVALSFSKNDSMVIMKSSQPLKYWETYNLKIAAGFKSAKGGQLTADVNYKLLTELDPGPKFPTLTDDELLTKVQQQTFKYFWDFAHPASGMARERNTSGDIVTTGGSGFGIMAIVTGMSRGFVTRTEGIDRLKKIIGFLETADRFHGAWPHWINGNTGKVVPFSTKDDGGDLVETSFLVQGLLTARQYLNSSVTEEQNLIQRINALWEAVEWNWYRKNNEDVLYWHWSPKYNWDMNFAMYGYFEEQITYALAAASPTHSIPKSVYANGYARNGAIKTNATFYNYKLPLGSPAPLFWVHYSYLGLNPHFSDDYADYWQQNVNATLINRAYCISNPKSYMGYGESCWGLTSSDNANGYAAHSPTNDLGVISPTAALSSFPYTPVESMKALKFFYYTFGDHLWGNYGFYDAFNLSEKWVAGSYLAIDQGPVIIMIENHRTGLLWNLFMSCPEIQSLKTKLDFKF